jgi:hypothetical protein
VGCFSFGSEYICERTAINPGKLVPIPTVVKDEILVPLP